MENRITNEFSMVVMFWLFLLLVVSSQYNEVNESGDTSLVYSLETNDWLDFRNNVVPIHYDLIMNPNLKRNNFSGEVIISVKIAQTTNLIIVHEKNLNILNSKLYDGITNETVEIKRIFRVNKYDYLDIETTKSMNPGLYILCFEFTGAYEYGIGLYKEAYEDTGGTRYIATTFFAPNYARRAFPCFDEPSFKATFSVSVLHDSEHYSISNMPVARISSIKNSMMLTKFEKTPSMSVYLLCIVVCDFKYKETISENGVKIRSYATKNNIESTDIALNWTSKILTFFERYLNVSYPLQKLDIISLPEFDANGMENWGLITYKEQSLLVDNASAVSHKLEVAKLIAHELAHMWFGDLVTMKWWDDTWLNEGFATHFAWKGAMHVLPEYFKVNDKGISELVNIMQQDETIYTRPVIQSISDVIYSDVYSSIVYKKGASLLRMLERYIGEKTLISGVSQYLKKHAYGNVETEDLWREIDMLSNNQATSVSKIMKTWFTEKNFPYIDAECQLENNCTCRITQYRFLQNRDLFLNQYFEQVLWNIPLSYTTSESTSLNYFMLESNQKDIYLGNNSEWIKFNSLFSGYFSVNYSSREWENFINILENNHTVFSEADRVSFIFDSFTLSSDGKLSYNVPLSLIHYLKKEEYYQSWSLANEFINNIKNYLTDDKNTTLRIRRYMTQLAKPLYRKYRWENKGEFLQKQLRRQLINAMCSNNGQSCLKTAVHRYEEWMNGKIINPEVAELVYKYGLKALNNETSYNKMWSQYLNETNPLLKAQYRDALPNVRRGYLLKRLLEDSMDRKYFRSTWQVPMIKSISRNKRGFSIVASYIFNKWDNLLEKFGAEQAENIAESVFSKYQTERDLQRVREFYEVHSDTSRDKKSRLRTLNTIQLRIHWKQKFQAQVAEWFQKNFNI